MFISSLYPSISLQWLSKDTHCFDTLFYHLWSRKMYENIGSTAKQVPSEDHSNILCATGTVIGNYIYVCHEKQLCNVSRWDLFGGRIWLSLQYLIIRYTPTIFRIKPYVRSFTSHALMKSCFKRDIKVSWLLLFKSGLTQGCLLYTSPSPRDLSTSRMPSSAWKNT